jgi:hypothetical protein
VSRPQQQLSAAIDVQVVWSKGLPAECKQGSKITLAMQNLQEMHNYMLAKMDQGRDQLRIDQAKGIIPAMPPNAGGNPTQSDFVNGAPPAEQNVQADLTKEVREADRTENSLSEQ